MSTRNEPLLVAPDWGTDALAVVDLTAPEGPEVRFTTVGSNPRAVAVSTDGTRAYVVDHDDETLSVVDLTAPEHPVLPPVPAGNGPCAVVAGLVDDQICVASADGKVEVFDKEGRGGQRLTVGTGPCALAAAPGGGARRVCVISETDARVSVVDVSQAGAPSVSASVSVPGVTRAVAVAPGGRFAYVASRGEGTADGRVTVLDLDANGAAVGDPVPVGAEPRALAIGPTGDRLCVANYGSASVSVATVDVDSGRVGTPDTVPAGAHPVAVAFDPAGEVIHVVSQTSGTLTAVRADTLDHTAVALGGVPAGVVFGPDGRHSYVTDQATGRLTVVRAAPRKSACVSAGEGSKPVDVAVSPDGTWAYAADSASDKVAVLDLSGLDPLAAVPLGPTHRPWGVAVAPDLGFACATSPDSSHLLVLTPAQGDKLTGNGEVTVAPVQLAPGACPHGVAVTPDGYVVTADSGTAAVSLVDPKGGTHTIDAEVVGCQEPTGAAVSRDGRTLYVADFASKDEPKGHISILRRAGSGEWQREGVIDAATGQLWGPHEMALSPDELRLYVANYESGTVSVLIRDAVGAEWRHVMTVVKPSTPMKWPNGLALSPDGTTLYVSNNTNGRGTVEVFDVSTPSAAHQRTIEIVVSPDRERAVNVGLAISPDGHYLYAVDAERWKPGTGALGTVYGIQLTAGGDQMETVATAPQARTDRPGALVCRDDRTLYVVNQGRKESPDPREACLAVITLDASRLGVESAESRPLDKDDLPYSAAISDDGTLYVANFTSRTVTVFGSKVTPVPVGEAGASQPWDVAVTDDGAYAYVTDRTADSLRCLRLSDHHVTSMDVGRDPMGVACAPGGLRAYVANHGSDSISVIGPDDASPGTPKVIDTWEHSRIIKPESVSVSADGAWLFVTTENSGELLMLDARTGTPRFTVPAGDRLTGSAPGQQSAKHLVYLADEAGAAVSVVDTTTLAPLDTTTPLGLDVRQAVGVPTTN